MMARRWLPVTLASAFFVGALSACASGAGPGAVAPQDTAGLEAENSRHPDDPTLLTRLGIAYYQAGNYEKARDVLRSVFAIQKVSYSAAVYLGLSEEQLGDLAAARQTYGQAAGMTTKSEQKDEIRNRLALLTRKELQFAARQALAREAELSATPPEANSVAVFPFRYIGVNEDLRPLERGLTHLVITDLSRVESLRLLERERVQVLVDEMQLTEAGRVDGATGARSGRLLRAAQVVQGSLQDLPAPGRLKLDADVVNSSTATVVAEGTAEDGLQRLIDAEKGVVLQLLQRMGITLTPAEQRAISERPTADLQAFLAFSRGLEAEDRGDFTAAQSAYAQAVSRDPNFRIARDRRDQTIALTSATELPETRFAGLDQGLPAGSEGSANVEAEHSVGGTLRSVVAVSVPSSGGIITTEVNTIPVVRPPLPESLGVTEPTSPGLTGNIIIIITQP